MLLVISYLTCLICHDSLEFIGLVFCIILKMSNSVTKMKSWIFFQNLFHSCVFMYRDPPALCQLFYSPLRSPFSSSYNLSDLLICIYSLSLSLSLTFCPYHTLPLLLLSLLSAGSADHFKTAYLHLLSASVSTLLLTHSV